MSLLLDALRRAAASKQGPESDQYTVPRRADSPLERQDRDREEQPAAGEAGPGTPSDEAATDVPGPPAGPAAQEHPAAHERTALEHPADVEQQPAPSEEPLEDEAPAQEPSPAPEPDEGLTLEPETPESDATAGADGPGDRAELSLEPEESGAAGPAGPAQSEPRREPTADRPPAHRAAASGAAAAAPGGREGTRRAAAGALLGAGRRPRRLASGSVLRPLIGVALVLVALGAIGLGGWWYYQESQWAAYSELARYRPVAEPLANQGSIGADADAATTGSTAESVAAAAPVEDGGPEAARSTASAGTVAAAGSERAALASAQTETPATAAEPADAARAAIEPEPTAQAGAAGSDTGTAAAGQAVLEPEPTSEAGAAEPAPAATTTAEAAQQEPAAAGTEPPAAETAPAAATAGATEPVRRAAPLIRASGPSELARTLEAGYAALREGDLAAAGQAYARALELAPTHRDALLGAASVAHRSGDPARAAGLYRRVLRDNPRDPHARAALVSLQGDSAPRRSETELKGLLRQQPDSASLHYALGNVYAGESRWSEAQRAYFEAHRNEPDNPDYAYNLAVALDHLGKREAAAAFYRKALDAGAGRGTTFAPELVRRRLEQLQ